MWQPYTSYTSCLFILGLKILNVGSDLSELNAAVRTFNCFSVFVPNCCNLMQQWRDMCLILQLQRSMTVWPLAEVVSTHESRTPFYGLATPSARGRHHTPSMTASRREGERGSGEEGKGGASRHLLFSTLSTDWNQSETREHLCFLRVEKDRPTLAFDCGHGYTQKLEDKEWRGEVLFVKPE